MNSPFQLSVYSDFDNSNKNILHIFTGGLGLLWDLFWIYIVTFTIKKLCNLKYKNGAYVASLLFLFFWFKYDMSPPIDFK